MRMVIQSEAAECGLACLAIIAAHHGDQISLRELRQRFPVSLKGVTLARLIEISSSLGFSPRPVRLDLDSLSQLETPCILHWDLSHFVVLVKAVHRHVVIADPARGRRTMSYSEASKHFTGVALELQPAKAFKPRKTEERVSVWSLTGPISGLWRTLSLVLLMSLGLQVFVILGPLYLQWVVDQVLVSADRGLLTVVAIGFGLIMLFQCLTHLLRGLTVSILSSRLVFQWIGNVFRHLIRLPLDFFEKRHLGDVVSRMDSVRAIQRTLTTTFIEAVIDGIMAIVTLGMMLLYSWQLFLITLIAVIIYLALRASSFWFLRDATEKSLVATARQHSYLFESIRGVQSIKIAGRENMRSAGYMNRMNDAVNRDLTLSQIGVGFTTANQFVFGIERVMVVWFGAILALENVFSVGMLIAYLAYKEQFSQRIGGLIDKLIEFRMLRLHGERLSDIVLTPREPDVEHGVEIKGPIDRRIEVKNLFFRYAEGEPWILRDCSFVVEDGESVAIVGASGCGKSTLVKIMLGLLAPTRGSITIGGKDIHQAGAQNVRSLIGAVMQDDQLFAGTVIENIAFSDEGFDEVRVESSARLAAIHDDISAMPMGYHSLIGDMGTTLSGGQKQRVVLARALYRQPSFLFLDEATSHLDVGAERLVNEAVKQLNLTQVIVAHRPETIASADRVLVLTGGAVSVETQSTKMQGESAARFPDHSSRSE